MDTWKSLLVCFSQSAKVMVSRMTLVLWVLEAKLVTWLYEQPRTSLMWESPRLQDFISKATVYRSHIYMGSYGSESPKPTYLWSCSKNVGSLSIPLPSDVEWTPMLDVKTTQDGKKSVSGNKSLKDSQTYPKNFGPATIKFWRDSELRPFRDATRVPKVTFRPRDPWHDADLTEVFQFLSLGTLKL